MTYLSNVITPSNIVTLTGVATLTNKTIGVSQLSGNVAVANGGTGTSNPGTSGNVLTSNGTSWVSQVPSVTKSIAYAIVMGL
jgi:hypothetical protein